ncbi:BspA family leucine-rich repeat surface protein [Marivirga sp. S37H4]|uniref:BspA family leucine-rich repeat surface protein n=1 Tax=Marivirga aurantiaca TaxID=2802615 RepID=A0A935C7J2_9BACT|nr:BspA family leucine-rich repeat surface protein [Marivirga aurantiaca]MBK6265046.1 BspA family leucine-rich repeat surface protein [Marivirga aurantiaca]
MRNFTLFLTALFLSLIFSFELSAQGFVTIWKTDNPGTSEANQISIPTTGTGYNYDIFWEEVGNNNNNGTLSGIAGNTTIDFPSAGTYRLSITGDFPRIYFNNAGDKDKVLSIEQWGDISWTSMEYAFYGCSNLISNAVDAPDLSLTSSMFAMFAGASSFNSDLNTWDVSNVNNMYGMFLQATSFNGDISNWNVSNVTNMTAMFYFASAFNGDLSSWNVSNVTEMSYMFSGTNIFNSDLSNWNVGNVINMSRMFNNAISFNQDLNSWSVGSVTNMSLMFAGATSFNGDISNWYVGSVTNMSSMFNGASSFNQNLENWYVYYVTNMATMFFNASSFNQSLGSWNIRNVTNMTGMLDNSGLSTKNYDATLTGWANLFSTPTSITLGATGLTYCNSNLSRQSLTQTYGWTINSDSYNCLPFITTWQTTNGEITIPTHNSETYSYDISWTNLTTPGAGNGSAEVISGSYTITDLNNNDIYQISISGDFPRIYFANSTIANRSRILSIEQWGDIKWTDMSYAFYYCINLISNANDAPLLSNVLNLNSMFAGATAFNGDLSNWNVSNVSEMDGMFSYNTSFNSNLSNWDVSNVTTMGSMFEGAPAFDSDLSSWDVSNVTNMYGMFDGAALFNSDLNSWDVSNVTNMSRMFSEATSFNSNLSDWRVNNVLSMSRMFENATSFNSDLSKWNVGNVNSMNGMFAGATIFNSDLSNWDVRNVTTMSAMFHKATAFNSQLDEWDVSKVVDMGGMFWDATSFNQSLENWDISSVEPFAEETSGPIGLDSMLTNSALSPFNYDATISGWATLSTGETEIPLNLNVGAHNLNFCFSGEERSQLIENYGWAILDNGPNCPLPLTQATNITFTNVTVSQMDIGWTAGDGANRLVLAREGALINAPPVSSTTYTANAVFGNGQEIGSGNYVVYNGNGNNFTLTGLSEGTTYHLRVYEYNGQDLLEVYNTTTATGNPASQTTFVTPVISSFTPTSTGENKTVTITGNNFTTVNEVSFGGVNAASFNVISDTEIAAVVASGASGDVLVSTPGGTATLAGFTFVPAPTVTSFSPSSAAQGETVTIIGTDFINASLVSFGGTDAASFNVISDTEITAMVGSGASGDVLVTTLGGTTVLTGFTFIPAPTVTSFSPTSAAEGETVTIIGTDFSNASSVSFGGTDAASFTVISDTEITAVVASGASGDVLVSTPGGNTVLTGFTFIPAPTVASFSPASAAEGETVTIIGTGLLSTSSVSFGETDAASFSVISDTEIAAVVASGTSGDVLVSTPGGTATLAGFTFVPAPVITSFNPTSAAQGETVTIIGTDFTNASLVSFGGTNVVSYTVISDTEIAAVVGSGASGDVLVSTPGGTATLSGFEFTTEPVINSFSPLSATQGTIITIMGGNLSAATSVFFGDTEATSFAVISPNIITAVVGEGSTGIVSVNTPSGNASMSGFTFLSAQIAVSSENNVEIINNQQEVISSSNTIIGENKQHTFEINNPGNISLLISEITSSNPAFKVQQFTELIAPGASGHFILDFQANEVGLYTSEISLKNNSKQESFNFSVSAEVVEVNFINSENEIVILSNEDINVGSTLINVDLAKTVGIKNKSSISSIQINSISINNPVFQVTDQPTTIAPLSTEEFSIKLVSAVPGDYRGTLSISTNINDFSFQVVGTVLEEELPEIKVFNLITPNGDKRHDFLFIENIHLYPDNTVTIFNRWGNKLSEINNYNNNDRIFEGLSDNKEELLSGNYYYVIDKGNGDKRINGFFFIQR